MDTRLSFEQVCEDYEFADWELNELVAAGAIAAERDAEGAVWFDSAEIIRVFRATPGHFFSFKIASRIYGKSEKTLRRQAMLKRLRGKKISYAWATNAESMDRYMAKYARNT